MNRETDKKLVDLFFQRKETAISSTLKEYSTYLNSIAYRILKNREDMEECVNDTMMKAWSSIPPNIPDCLRAYLGAFVRNIALDSYRKQHYSKRNKDFQVMLDECSDLIAVEGNPEEVLDLTVMSDCISKYLLEETEEKRYLFTRRYYFADSIKELATKRGLSESKVKVTLHRMRQELHKKLEKEGIDL